MRARRDSIQFLEARTLTWRLGVDIGGTTAKGALVRGFTALKQYDLEVGRVHEFKSGSGLPVKLPVIDVIASSVRPTSHARWPAL